MRTLSLRDCFLEDRLVPAGSVAASVVSGVLTLTGDDDNNVIRLVPITNGFNVVGEFGTAITGGPSFTGVTGIRANMLDGNDWILIDDTQPFTLAGSSTFNMGDGRNTLDLITAEKLDLGAVTVVNGDGADLVRIAGGLNKQSSTGNITIGLGIGYNTFQDPPYINSFVGISELTINGGFRLTSSDGVEEVELNKVTVTGALTFSGGEDALQVQASNSTFKSVALDALGPAVSSAGGVRWSAIDSTVQTSTSIRSSYGSVVTIDNSTTGPVTVTTTGGDTTIDLVRNVTINGMLKATGVHHSLFANNGAVATVTGPVNLMASNGASISLYDGKLTTPSLTLNGTTGASVYLSASGDPLLVPRLQVNGPMTVTGRYNQWFQYQGDAIITGALNIAGGTDSIVEIGNRFPTTLPDSTINVGGVATIRARDVSTRLIETTATFGRGLNLLGVEETLFAMEANQRTASANFPDSPAFGDGSSVTVNTLPLVLRGRSVYMEQVEGVTQYNGGLQVFATEDATVTAFPKQFGYDENDLEVYGIGPKFTASKVTMVAPYVGLSQDEGEATITRGVSLTAPGGSASMFMGSAFIQEYKGVKLNVPSGEILLTGSSVSYDQEDGDTNISGNVTLRGGGSAGFRVYQRDTFTEGKFTTGGNLTVDGGTTGSVGMNAFGQSFNVTGNVVVRGADTGTYFSSLSPSTVGGNVLVTGGNGFSDYFTAEGNLTINGDVTLNLGSGSNKIGIGAHGGTIALNRNLTINTTTGSDAIATRNLTVSGRTSINMGEGTDRLFISAGTVFNGVVAANLGGGADTFEVGLDFTFQSSNYSGGTVTFNAPATVLLGNGNDTLGLGIASDPDRKLLFGTGGTLNVNGGANMNLFDNEAGQFDPLKVTYSGFTDPTP